MLVREVMVNDYIKADADDHLSTLLGKLKEFNRINALVFERDEFYGVLDKKRLLESRPMTMSKVKNFCMHVPVISPEDDIKDTARLFIATNSSLLPVAYKEKVVGALPIDYVLSQIRWMNASKKKVEDITHHEVIKASPNSKLGDVINKLKESSTDRVVLEDNFGIAGTVTISDLIEYFLTSIKKQRKGSIGKMWATQFDPSEKYTNNIPISVFSKKDNLITISPSATCLEAAKKMLNKKINSVIVEKNGKALYLISKLDLLNEMIKKEKESVLTIVGLKETNLDDFEKKYVFDLCNKNIIKITRALANVNEIIIHIKEYKKSTNSKGKFSVHIKVVAPTKIIAIDRSSDWDLARALHKAFADIMHRIEHRITRNYDKFVA